MPYRNGTYVAFHAEGTNVPIDTDFKYYNLLKAWTEKRDDDFSMIDSHEKGGAVRDSSKKKTLELRLKERLRNSRNMILIIGDTTKNDIDWVPMEIEYAVDTCDIPIIAAYPEYEYIMNPNGLSSLWPKALKDRIENGTASVIHVPFKKEPLKDAISQFDHENKPKGGGLGFYSKEAYHSFGIPIK
jgi:hypothetical protein